ncbi:MAG: cation-efflux pump [Actinobacteria bacterium]|nr:cation-efflux pump [Actinomycetota bacterium]
MSPQRRTVLVSVLAAAALVALKLGTGIATGSLGLISEAAHSGTDLVAALLTFFAIGVAGRPADRGHPYGHGKAEHLAALAEGGILVVLCLAIAWRALDHLLGASKSTVNPAWYAIAVLGLVIVVDLFRMIVSARAAGRYGSAALQANALHFGSDLLGSTAVLGGLLLARAGYPDADSAAALLVAALVLVAAGRLMRRNVDVLMDRAPAGASEAARRAIAQLEPAVQLSRLRIRQSAGRHFADVVIAVPPGAAVGQGHAAADAVEAAVQKALPEADVVVHVEPGATEATLRERALGAAQHVPRVREIHNLSLVSVEGRTELSLHLKLPGGLTLDEAHAVSMEVERAIHLAVPEIDSVQTHLEPIREPAEARAPAPTDIERETETVLRIVREATGAGPRRLRFLETDDGLVAYLTLGLDPRTALEEAHTRASEIERRIRRERPSIADVVVHTEP